jgi:hypothetical protein
MSCKKCDDYGWFEMGGYDFACDHPECLTGKKLRIEQLRKSIKAREKSLKESRKQLKNIKITD